jgi:predicted secreted protein
MAAQSPFNDMNRRHLIRTSLAFAATLASFATHAQLSPPENVLQLSASATLETQQDQLSLSLGTRREGEDANAVQSQLKTALDAALAEARKAAQPGQLDVRTGHFGLMPRYEKGGRISGWQGTAELVLEGRDFARITQTAARISSMTISHVNFSLSREQRAKVETDAQALAIERFKAKASELARGFGFAGYTLREVSVNANDMAPPVPRQAMAMARSASSDMPLPVEAGKTTVTVTVSGSVQLK